MFVCSLLFFFFSSRRRHTRLVSDWSSDVCSSDLMSQELFRTAYAFIGHLRGGLALATIVGCAGFGAICGSSIADAATFAKVDDPSVNPVGYSDSVSTFSISVGRSVCTPVPPSPLMVYYG